MKVLERLGIGMLAACAFVGAVHAQTQVLAWGLNDDGQCNVPALPPGSTCVEVAGGFPFSVMLLDDGSVVAWGIDITDAPALPPGLTYTQISAQYYTAAALRSDGAVVAWGLTAPMIPPDPDFVQVAGCYFHVLAIRNDGSIAAWGDDSDGQLDVPALPPGLTAVQVAGGVGHSVALLSDGSVIAWGLKDQGQCDVPALPAGSSYVGIAANTYYTIAMRSDGSLIAWGLDSAGQLDVPALPPGLTYVAVAAGADHAVALRSDGSVDAWGWNGNGQCDVPALPPGFRYVGIGAGLAHSLAIRESDFTCGSAASYCASTPNSSGQAATIGVWGSIDVAVDDMHLASVGCPPGHKGLFFYGLDTAQIPMGNGYLCISPFNPGLFRLGPVTVIDAMGRADHAVDFDAFLPGGQITAGSTWNFQFWFRDPAAGGTGTNLSDAVRVSFCP